MKKFEYKKIYDSNSSFQLIRTNPKLTGNVKIVVDSNEHIYLNSISANETLSQEVFQKVAIDTKVSYGDNLKSFFNKVNIQNNSIFHNKQNLDLNQQLYKFDNQYAFEEYFTSVRYTESNYYDEYFAYFAPLYLQRDIPEYFVIFRIEGALDERLDLLSPDRTNEKVFLDLLERAKIIKTFDLSRSSTLGKFLWEMVDDLYQTDTELDVNFDSSIITWNGHSLNNGALTGYSSYEPEVLKQATPLKEFEDFVIKGYETHGIVYPHIVNLEFLFDDVESEYYDFNRYIGLFVNQIELAKLRFDFNKFLLDYEVPNYDKYKDYHNYDEIQENVVSGEFITLPVDYISNNFKFDDVQPTDTNPIVSAILDKDNKLHSVKWDTGFEIVNDELVSVTIDAKNAPIDAYFGTGNDFLQIEGENTDIAGKGHTYALLLSDLYSGDVFKIYHSKGTRNDGDGDKYDLIEVAETEITTDPNSDYLTKPGDLFFYIMDNEITTDPPIESNIYQFYGKGEHGNMYKNAQAFGTLVNSIPGRTFQSFVYDSYVFIKMINAGESVNVRVEYISAGLYYNSVEMYEKTGDDLIGTQFQLVGSSKTLNRIVFDNEHLEYITENQDSLFVKTENGISKIKEIAKYIDVINNKYQDYDTYFSKSVIVLDSLEIPQLIGGQMYLMEEYETPVRLLSFTKLKDFDYEFYSDRYNKFPIWELYKYYSIPPNKDLLEQGKYYKVVGEGTIAYYTRVLIDTNPDIYIVEEATYNSGEGTDSVFLPVPDTGAGYNIYQFNIVSGNPIVIYSDIDKNGDPIVTNPLFDANDDIIKFTGFFGLRDNSVNIPYANTDDYLYNKRFYDHMVKSEYNAYRENYTVQHAHFSKIVPYVCKWGYVNGTDSRDNPYRLNAHSVFGLSNIGPDFNRYTADVNSLTHEWFYIIASYDFIKDPNVKKLNYTYFEKQSPISIQTLDVSDDFIDYFYYTIVDDSGKQIAPGQQRFSFIEYNPITGLSKTFFKGIEFVFYDNEQYDNSKFDKYKFTIILKPIEEVLPTKDNTDADNPPIKIEFIEDSANKYIVLMIKFYIGSIDLIDSSIDDITKDNYKTIYTDNTIPHVDGDYRIKYYDEISDITHLFFYGVDNKKFNNKIDRHSTIKIPSGLNLINNQKVTNGNRISTVTIPNFSNYTFDLRDFVSLAKPVNYLKMELNGILPGFLNINIDGSDKDSKSPTYGVESNILELRKDGSDDSIVITDAADSIKIDLSVGVSQNPYPHTISQIKGGNNYFDKIFNMLSFATIKDLINNNDPMIEYPEGDGFSIRVINPGNVYKESDMKAIVSEYKPEIYEDTPVASYDLAVNDTSTYILQRYNGKYEPIFKDIFFYKTYFEYSNPSNITDYEKIKIANVEFMPEYDKFSLLTNFNYLKVSEKRILNLDNDKNGNAYEILDEISIDNNDILSIRSDWDWNYHFNYIDKINNSMVPGTYRMIDNNSFVTKHLVLPKEITLLDYSMNYVTENHILNVFNVEDTIDYSFQSIYNDSNGIKMAFNLDIIFTKVLMDNGVWENIQKYLPDDIATLNGVDLDQFTKEYLKNNIIDLFDLDVVELYVKEVPKNIENKVIIPDENTSTSILINDGYKLRKDAQINKRNISTVIIDRNMNYNYIVYPFIKMKLI